MTTLPANRAVTETLDRLESLAKERGLTIFARINFSADARRAGLSLRPTELLILGMAAQQLGPDGSRVRNRALQLVRVGIAT